MTAKPFRISVLPADGSPGVERIGSIGLGGSKEDLLHLAREIARNASDGDFSYTVFFVQGSDEQREIESVARQRKEDDLCLARAAAIMERRAAEASNPEGDAYLAATRDVAA